MDAPLAQPTPALKRHEILEPMVSWILRLQDGGLWPRDKGQWTERDRVHFTTKEIRPDLLEVHTTSGTLLGTYQRVEYLGWIEMG